MATKRCIFHDIIKIYTKKIWINFWKIEAWPFQQKKKYSNLKYIIIQYTDLIRNGHILNFVLKYTYYLGIMYWNLRFFTPHITPKGILYMENGPHA